jgi:uncharacterized membrane protein YhaH (DUF805 family)
MSISPIFLIFTIILFVPFIYILRDKRLEKEQKVGWLILVFLFSWLAFPFYLIKNKD